MSRLEPSPLRIHRRAESDRMDKLFKYRNFLYRSVSVGCAKRLAIMHVNRLFLPQQAFFIESENNDFPELKPVIEYALRENRVVYFPDLKADRVVITDNVEGKLYDVYSARPESLGIMLNEMQNGDYRQIAIAPVISIVNIKGSSGKVKQWGVLVLFFREPYASLPELIPSKIKILRMYADYFALTMHDKSSRTFFDRLISSLK